MDAVIFDFDGLILDTEWPAYITVAEVFEEHGATMPLDSWQTRIGRGDNPPWTEELEAALGRAIDHDRVAEARRAKKDALTDATPIQPGVMPLLDRAGALGLRTGVASSSPLSWVGRHLERLGVRDRFGALRTADDVVRTKPWPDVFLAAAEALGVAPHRSIVLEDSSHGVAAAKAAGMYCIAIPNRITATLDFSAADQVVTSLEAIDLRAVIAHAGGG